MVYPPTPHNIIRPLRTRTKMEAIDVVILVCLVVIMFFIYAGLVASRTIMDELKEANVQICEDRNRANAKEGVMFEIVQELDTAIRENTAAMTAHIDSIYRGVEDDIESDDGLGNGGLVVD